MSEPEHGPAALANADRAVADLLWSTSSIGSGSIRIVNAPAGAGKTGLVTRLIPRHVDRQRRVAVVTQTNEQANDLTARLAADSPTLPIVRFHSTAHTPPPAPANVITTSEVETALHGDVVVATADKWAFSAERLGSNRFDVAIIDEAYQMAGGKLLYIADLFDSLDLVGDPGQLSPFSQVDTERWSGLVSNPTKNAVDTIRSYHDIETVTLPVTRRLPASAADVIRPAFYPDLLFAAATGYDDRKLGVDIGDGDLPDRIVDHALASGWAYGTLPPKSVARNDRDLAALAAAVAKSVLRRNVRRVIDEHHGLPVQLTADRIAIGASHRDQVAAIQRALAREAVTGVVVDTANRLQGREFDLVIAWHPLSGQAEAGAFHLDVGRLCVLTTRHRHACIVLSRGGIAELLDASVPIGEGVLGDVVDRSISGWEAHCFVLDHLEGHTVAE